MGASSTAGPRRNRTQRQSAPLGVKLLCVLGVLGSVLTFLLSFRLMAAGGPVASLGVLFVFLSAAHLVVVYGLWTLQPWGWTWGMIVFVLGAIMDLVRGNPIGFVISIVVIAYLASVKDLYER